MFRGLQNYKNINGNRDYLIGSSLIKLTLFKLISSSSLLKDSLFICQINVDSQAKLMQVVLTFFIIKHITIAHPKANKGMNSFFKLC